MVVAVLGVDKLKIDDPGGAISVHSICGIWGTLAVGIFSGEYSILIQLVGIFALVKAITAIRVSEGEELRELDIGEHGMEAYTGFQIFIVP